MRVPACDGIHEDGLAMLREAGYEVAISDPIKDPAALANVDVLLVRSATQVKPLFCLVALTLHAP